MTIENYKVVMRAAWQTVICRRDAIKRALIVSNANTIINVNGRTYTVAEAIELRVNGMQHKKNLLSEMRENLRSAQERVNATTGEEIERKAEQYITSIIAAQPRKAKMATTDDAMRATYIRNNSYSLLDPLSCAAEIEKLEREIVEFENEVDAALSVSNALTIISISY